MHQTGSLGYLETKDREMKTKEELKQFAADLKAGRLFTSGMIPDARNIPLVFTPGMLLDEKGREEMKHKFETKEVVLFYEELSKATSRTDDGLPIFPSMQTLSGEELDAVKSFIGDPKQKIPREPQEDK